MEQKWSRKTCNAVALNFDLILYFSDADFCVFRNADPGSLCIVPIGMISKRG
jgi:hypothetical protein